MYDRVLRAILPSYTDRLTQIITGTVTAVCLDLTLCSIGAVLGKCSVKRFEDVEKDLETYCSDKNNFWYKSFYDSVKKRLTEKEPPAIGSKQT